MLDPAPDPDDVDDLDAVSAGLDVDRVVRVTDAASGLDAVLVLDDRTLGPAAGGVRTRAYASAAAALADAAALARAMTIKCAVAGLDAGGGKCVVRAHPGLDRAAAFARLGEAIEALGGAFRTAGDLGTTAADLAAMAARCRYVHTDVADLAAAVARGLVGCVRACVADRGGGGHGGGASLAGLRVAVQGAGAIGAAVARALVAAGADVRIADVDAARAGAVAAATGAAVVAPDAVLAADVDVVAPCAVGGVLDEPAVDALRAWAVCGAANNVVASPAAAARLVARGVRHVPDVVASAGAVIDGIGATVMGLDAAARGALIDRLGDTARRVLDEARARRAPADVVVAELAWARIGRRRR